MSENPRALAFDIGWQLMDLRQDVEFYSLFMAEPYPVQDVIERLRGIQSEAKELMAMLPYIEEDQIDLRDGEF